MGIRRKGREAALQILYQMDVSELSSEAAVRNFWSSFGAEQEGRDFADTLVRGLSNERDAVDERLRAVSENWRLERMPLVDRNILRLGTYELCYVPDIPKRVTLNEAVELAKRFGNESSPAFVNGLLDRIAAGVEKE